MCSTISVMNFLERANAAHSTAPSSLAVLSYASTQACATGKAAKIKLPNPHPLHFGLFTHVVRTKANGIKFAHQLLCSPTILTIFKAIRRGFLNRCPNLSAKGVSRYLNPSPATAKDHMKRPHQVIQRTKVQQPRPPTSNWLDITSHATPTADEDS